MAKKRIFGTLKTLVGAQALRAKVLARIDDLPSSPAIAAEIDSVISDPNSTLADIEVRIVRDQALAAKLLRLVNSSYYGLSKQVTSLSRAISLAGMKTIRSLIYAVTTSPLLEKNLPVYGYEPLGLWTHSLATAVAAQAISSRLKPSVVTGEEFFVAGLLHDMGKLVLGEFLGQASPRDVEALISCGGRCLEVERQLTGFDHAELGRLLAQKWNMSPMLTALIACHHNPAAAKEYAAPALVVVLADAVARRLKSGFNPEIEIPAEIDPRICELLNLEDDLLETVIPQVAEQLEQQLNLFKS